MDEDALVAVLLPGHAARLLVDHAFQHGLVVGVLHVELLLAQIGQAARAQVGQLAGARRGAGQPPRLERGPLLGAPKRRFQPEGRGRVVGQGHDAQGGGELAVGRLHQLEPRPGRADHLQVRAGVGHARVLLQGGHRPQPPAGTGLVVLHRAEGPLLQRLRFAMVRPRPGERVDVHPAAEGHALGAGQQFQHEGVAGLGADALLHAGQQRDIELVLVARDAQPAQVVAPPLVAVHPADGAHRRSLLRPARADLGIDAVVQPQQVAHQERRQLRGVPGVEVLALDSFEGRLQFQVRLLLPRLHVGLVDGEADDVHRHVVVGSLEGVFDEGADGPQRPALLQVGIRPLGAVEVEVAAVGDGHDAAPLAARLGQQFARRLQAAHQRRERRRLQPGHGGHALVEVGLFPAMLLPHDAQPAGAPVVGDLLLVLVALGAHGDEADLHPVGHLPHHLAQRLLGGVHPCPLAAGRLAGHAPGAIEDDAQGPTCWRRATRTACGRSAPRDGLNGARAAAPRDGPARGGCSRPWRRTSAGRGNRR